MFRMNDDQFCSTCFTFHCIFFSYFIKQRHAFRSLSPLSWLLGFFMLMKRIIFLFLYRSGMFYSLLPYSFYDDNKHQSYIGGCALCNFLQLNDVFFIKIISHWRRTVYVNNNVQRSDTCRTNLWEIINKSY